ncbi:MAG: hypothetical protein Kow0026_13140 [Oricola sp.]
MIAGHPVAALGRDGDAAKDVAASDHDRDLDAHVDGILDVAGDPVRHFDIDAKALVSHQGLA